MTSLYFPELVKPVGLVAPVGGGSDRTSAVYPSMKNVTRAWIVVYLDQATSATAAITPKQATAVAGTGTKVLTTACPIWSNLDCAASDALVQRTAATSYTTDAGVKVKMVIFLIEPAQCMDVNNGFDCIGVTIGTSHSSSTVSAQLICESKYGGYNNVSLITD